MQQFLNELFWKYTAKIYWPLLLVSWYLPDPFDMFFIGLAGGVLIGEIYYRYWLKDSPYAP